MNQQNQPPIRVPCPPNGPLHQLLSLGQPPKPRPLLPKKFTDQIAATKTHQSLLDKIRCRAAKEDWDVLKDLIRYMPTELYSKVTDILARGNFLLLKFIIIINLKFIF